MPFISRKIFLTGFTLVIGLVSNFAYASLSGTFTGTVDGNLSCISPTFGPTPYTGAAITLTATPGPPVNAVSLSISHPDFTYSASGTAAEISPNQFSISLSGSVNITGASFSLISGTGTLSGGTSAILQGDGTLDLDFASYSGTNTSCTTGLVLITNPTTLTPTGGGADLLVDPEITPSTIITTPQILNTQVKAITSDLQTRINDVLRAIQLRRQQAERESSLLPSGEEDGVADNGEPREDRIPVSLRPTDTGFMVNTYSGLNAGDTPWPLGAWASYSYTDFENDFAPTAFDGRRHGGLAGVDISPWEAVLFGVAVGYEDNDIDTDFNRGNEQTDGFTIAPYFGALLTDTWSVSFGFGYSNLDTDQFRTDPATGARITSAPDHDRWFGMLNLNGLTTYGNWILGGQIGLLYAQDEQDAFVESDGTAVAEFQSELGQWNIGGDVAYSFGAFEPFVRATYENDFSLTKVGVIGGPQPSFDDDDVLFGVGLRYFGERGLSGNFEYNTRLGREDFEEHNFTATLRYEW